MIVAGFANIEKAARFPEPEAHFDQAALDSLERKMKAVREPAAKGRATEDLIEQRRTYGLISNELIDYVKKQERKKIANGEVHGYRCGMAGSMYKIPSEDWLQPKKGIRNPYMGRGMYG